MSKPRSPIAEDPPRAVGSSSRAEAGDRPAEAAVPPRSARPLRWLGADSPFGLSLPDAKPSRTTFYAPRGVWHDEHRLIVCDSGNHRVLIWNRPPDEDHAPADVVLGQPDFDREGPAAGGRGPEKGMYLPTGVLVAGRRLLVADAWHHRILVWNRIPTRSDTAPDYAIGQPDLASVEPNRGGAPSMNSLNWPYGIALIAGRLHVADTGNRRILVWDGFPENDRPADWLLGQDSEHGCDENRGGAVSDCSFRWPHDLAGDGRWWFIADAGNHRVLVFRGELRGDHGADGVIGQQDFATAYEFPYGDQGANRLRFPYAVDRCDNVLAVADTANNRILFWRLPLSKSRFAAAFDVIGQVDFQQNGENQWDRVTGWTLCWPYGISFRNGLLAVADSGNNRVMIWDCEAVIEAARKEPENDDNRSE